MMTASQSIVVGLSCSQQQTKSSLVLYATLGPCVSKFLCRILSNSTDLQLFIYFKTLVVSPMVGNSSTTVFLIETPHIYIYGSYNHYWYQYKFIELNNVERIQNQEFSAIHRILFLLVLVTS